jgi:hypothetical protein
MLRTPNYNLNKLQRSDKVLDSIDALSQNATIIDTTLDRLQDQIDGMTGMETVVVQSLPAQRREWQVISSFNWK